MAMSLFVDIFVVLVLLASVGIAFVRGFIREVLTIFGIIGGAAIAYVSGPLLTPVTRGWLGVDENAEEPAMLFDTVPYSILADVLAYGLIFIVFVVILSVISHFIAEFVKNIGLGALDRSLGVVFGVVRAVLVLGLMYMLFYYTVSDEQREEWFGESKSFVYLEATSKWMGGFLPADTEQTVKEGVEQIDNVSETRKKLQELDVLQGSESDKNASDQSSSDNKDGYSKEFRNKMDELIEKQIDQGTGNYNE